MKKIYTSLLVFLFIASYSFAQTSDDFVGTWRIAPQAEALVVGPELGSNEWWASSADDVTTRACFFDDTYVFSADGTFQNEMGGSTWLEAWQGVAMDECGAPVSPHDGSAAGTWAYNAGQLTITGVGSHLGLPKVINGAEIDNPANAAASITYDVNELSADGEMMTVDISFGGGWWRIVFAKDEAVSTSDLDEAKELFTFYPNPATDMVEINSTEVIDVITVKDIAGKEVMMTTNATSNATINVADLDSGLYLLECTSGDQRSVKKLFVQ